MQDYHRPIQYPAFRAIIVVFTRRYRPADGPGLCPVFIDSPAFVRCMSGVCPTYVRRTVKVGRNAGPSGERARRTVRRTEGVAIIARDLGRVKCLRILMLNFSAR